jgi:SAM-dependent methyltransferase
MPALQRPRQAAPLEAWASHPTGRRLLLDAQAAWRERDDGASGGQAWVRLLPDLDWPIAETNARFSGVWTVSPGIDGWCGAWRAGLGALPLASASVSRLDLRFVLESVPEPEALLADCARALREDGRMLVFGLNPWGLARLRWARRGVRALERGRVADVLKAEGLELLAQRTLGPRWAPRGLDVGADDRGLGLGRVAWAILATRRSAALTPLRRSAPAWRSTPGVPAS